MSSESGSSNVFWEIPNNTCNQVVMLIKEKLIKTHIAWYEIKRK